MIPETGQLDWTALEDAVTSRTAAARHRCRVECAGDHLRRRPRGGAGPRRRRALLRGRGPLCAARPGGCPPLGLRLPRLLGLQVLRAARGNSLWPGGTASSGSTCPSWSPPRRGAGAAGDRHAEPRRHRGRGRGGGVSRLAGDRRDAGGSDCSAAFEALHLRGQALLERLWYGLRQDTRRAALWPGAGPRRASPTVAFTVEGHGSDEVARRPGTRGRLRLARRLLRLDRGRAARARRRADWFARGAPATRPRTRWTVWWLACRSWRDDSLGLHRDIRRESSPTRARETLPRRRSAPPGW